MTLSIVICLVLSIVWLLTGDKHDADIIASIYLAAYWVIHAIQDLKEKDKE
jgi:hypothetical protein